MEDTNKIMECKQLFADKYAAAIVAYMYARSLQRKHQIVKNAITSLDKCTKEDPAKLKCNYSSFHYYMFIKKFKPKNRDVKLL